MPRQRHRTGQLCESHITLHGCRANSVPSPSFLLRHTVRVSRDGWEITEGQMWAITTIRIPWIYICGKLPAKSRTREFQLLPSPSCVQLVVGSAAWHPLPGLPSSTKAWSSAPGKKTSPLLLQLPNLQLQREPGFSTTGTQCPLGVTGGTAACLRSETVGGICGQQASKVEALPQGIISVTRMTLGIRVGHNQSSLEPQS